MELTPQKDIQELQTADTVENMTHTVQQISDSKNEQVQNTDTVNLSSVNTIIQQRIQDLQRIRDMQKMQRMQFLERLEQQQNRLGNEEKIIKQPMFSKIKFINGGSYDILRQIFNEFHKVVFSSLDKVEEINIDEFKTNINIVYDTISTYNQEINSWYDEKFNYDKIHLFKSINNNNEKLDSYMKMDFIHI